MQELLIDKSYVDEINQLASKLISEKHSNSEIIVEHKDTVNRKWVWLIYTVCIKSLNIMTDGKSYKNS